MENKEELNKLGVDFFINTGERNPKYITEETGIQYIQIREKGKPWIDYPTGEVFKQRLCKENNWIYRIEIKAKKDERIYLSQPLIEIINFLKENEAKFKSVFADPNNAMFLVVYGQIYDYHIYFKLHAELLKELSRFGIPVEFDIMSFTSDNIEK